MFYKQKNIGIKVSKVVHVETVENNPKAIVEWSYYTATLYDLLSLYPLHTFKGSQALLVYTANYYKYALLAHIKIYQSVTKSVIT